MFELSSSVKLLMREREEAAYHKPLLKRVSLDYNLILKFSLQLVLIG